MDKKRVGGGIRGISGVEWRGTFGSVLRRTIDVGIRVSIPTRH